MLRRLVRGTAGSHRGRRGGADRLVAAAEQGAVSPEKRVASCEPCPWFSGDRTVLERPHPSYDDSEPSIQPGSHAVQSGQHRVVWWDPASLALNALENFGLRHINVLKAEGASEESLEEYRKWGMQRSALLAQGASATISVVRVTELKEGPPDGAVSVERVADGESRARGRRFGTPVHAILRDAPWNTSRNEIARLAALHRVVGAATEKEEIEAASAANAAFEHTLLRRAAASGRCHRELPITLALSGNRMLEGVIDLAFIEDGHWHIVDFKTDEDLDVNRGQYEQQLRWYMHALTSLTGIPATGTLLQV